MAHQIPGASQQRVAVVAVHGVIPHARYEMQDDCATRLRDELNAAGAAGESWAIDVWQPPKTALEAPQPTVTRVHQVGDDANSPTRDFFDVIEAYWSPIDKGKTSALRVISWMLRTVFMPLNNTATYVAQPGKVVFDVAYISAAILAAGGLLMATLVLAAAALSRIVAGSGTPGAHVDLQAILDALGSPSSLVKLLTPAAIAYLVIGFIGGFLLWQGVRAAYSLRKNWDVLKDQPAPRTARFIAVAVLCVVGIGLLFLSSTIRVGYQTMGLWAIYFVLAGSTFVAMRSLLDSFIAAFFGDVQIYTTHDENSEFYGLRAQILAVVTNTIADTASATQSNGSARYDRVVILAHSLGSTIAMDALIRLSNAQLADPAFRDAFARIRAFITFGSSLEKTKYFFDSTRQSVSQAYDSSRNAQYGVMFSSDDTILNYHNKPDEGMFWANYWYAQDPVANKIESYRSFLVPGESISDWSKIRSRLVPAKPAKKVLVGRQLCRDEPGHVTMALLPFDRICIHGAYIGDDWFWRSSVNPDGSQHIGVLEILSRRPVMTSPSAEFAAVRATSAPHPQRYEVRDEDKALNLRDKI